MIKLKQLLKENTEILNSKDGKQILLSDYVKNHINTHNKIGVGSVFSKSININTIIEKIKQLDIYNGGDGAGKGGVYVLKVPDIGYNLVLKTQDAKKLNGATETTATKDERGKSIEVPAYSTTDNIEKFKTDILNIVIRPSNEQYLPDDVKKEQSVLDAIKNKTSYSVLTAYPGDSSIPPASQWNGQFAVVLPEEK